jgi:polysaccharide export outer membrane protein
MRTIDWRKPCSMLYLASLLAACSSFPKAPAYPRKEDGFSGPQQIPRPGIADDRAPPLRLMPGDIITIESQADPPKLLTGVVVDATGRIHLPLAGDVEVGGRALSDAEAKVQAAMRKYDKFAEVTIQIADGRGQRVSVLGAVTTQGSVILVPGARVADVIATAGGPLFGTGEGDLPAPMADLEGAVVSRGGRPLPISVAKALRGDPQHNVFMHPGDYIFVPPALNSSISVLGQVGAPRLVPFHPGIRLTQTLAMASGVTVGADKGDIRVIRGTLEAPRVYEASLSDYVAGKTNDVSMQPGDIVFVTDHRIEDIGEVIALVSPLLSLGLTGALTASTLATNAQTQAAAAGMGTTLTR